MRAYGEPPLVQGHFDRDAATRMEERSLDQAWRHPSASVLKIRNGEVPVAPTQSGQLALVLEPIRGERDESCYFLGAGERGPVFATKDGAGSSETASGISGETGDREWIHPFLAGERLRPLDREVMAVAFALLNWHENARFSPRDGGETKPIQGGWARLDADGVEHFPRTDPAVIVIVEHDDRLLLGSNVLWETGRFSLLAGFVEAGESAEQTVRREIAEEAGIIVDEVRYVASQPWPFPRSLMLGFRARLAVGQNPEALVRDATEISELRWFTREELRTPAAGILLPGKLSIARWMIDLWLAEGDREG